MRYLGVDLAWGTTPRNETGVVALDPDGRHLREVDEPQFFANRHRSPQPFLAPLDESAWHPARRLAPYRPRRQRWMHIHEQRLHRDLSDRGKILHGVIGKLGVEDLIGDVRARRH